MNEREMQDDIARLLPGRKGHFRLESGHHGDLWLDLELLCLRPESVRHRAAQIAARLAGYEVEAVCGPLIEGAFVALMVAAELGVPFTYAERFAEVQTDALYPVQYRLPRCLRDVVRGKRVAIVNDVINAGSAIRGTFADLKACGAEPVAIAALAVLGQSAAKFAADQKLALEALASLSNEIWTPAECPLCARRVPLADPHGIEGRGAQIELGTAN
jgi:orotate phosphoribosyltransferase